MSASIPALGRSGPSPLLLIDPADDVNVATFDLPAGAPTASGRLGDGDEEFTPWLDGITL